MKLASILTGLFLSTVLPAQDEERAWPRSEIIAGLRAAQAQDRVAALRSAEPRLAGDSDFVLQGLLRRLCRDSDASVRLQLAGSLGKTGRGRPILRRYAEESLRELLIFSAVPEALRAAAIESLDGAETMLLAALLADPRFAETWEGREELLAELAASILQRGRDESMAELLMLISEEVAGWRRDALLAGTLASLPMGEAEADKLVFRYRPRALDRMLASEDSGLQAAATRIEARSVFVGGARPLDTVEQARFERGKTLFSLNCVSCHQLSGLGGALAPPLVDSEWVTSESDDRLVRILNNGLTGPITVNGQRYEIAGMVGFPKFKDEQIAAVITYLRRAWGHEGEPTDAATVARIRGQIGERSQQWTDAELKQVR